VTAQNGNVFKNNGGYNVPTRYALDPNDWFTMALSLSQPTYLTGNSASLCGTTPVPNAVFWGTSDTSAQGIVAGLATTDPNYPKGSNSPLATLLTTANGVDYGLINFQAILGFRLQPMNQFRMVVGARSAVGRYWGGCQQDFTADPNAVFPPAFPTVAGTNCPDALQQTPPSLTGALKRKSDRGYCFSISTFEPVCECTDGCPEYCHSTLKDGTPNPNPIPAHCAMAPACECPTVCQSTLPLCTLNTADLVDANGNPTADALGGAGATCKPLECGAHNPPPGQGAKCPAAACPFACDLSQFPAGGLSYFTSSYCNQNPACPCPNGCPKDLPPGMNPSYSNPNGATNPADIQYSPLLCENYKGCASEQFPPACMPATPFTPPVSVPLPPPFPPPFPPLPCHSWCSANTCGMEECVGCSACESVAQGSYCASWCNMYTCASEHELCQGCALCSAPASSSTCFSWCSAYTCFGSCGSCPVCSQVAAGNYCASWCNAYTCGGAFTAFCGGCTECAQVASRTYCASWCNAYTVGGIFSAFCDGCPA